VTNRGIRAKIREYFERRPGQQVFLDDMAKDLGVAPLAIQSGVPNLMRDVPGYPLEVNIAARSWTYRPNTPPGGVKEGKRMFEEIGQAKEGIVIQDEAGKLYLAKEL
jgi:hypothetical protein